MDDIAALAHTANQDVTPRVVKLEKENQDLRNSTYITYYCNYYKYHAIISSLYQLFYMKIISNK